MWPWLSPQKGVAFLLALQKNRSDKVSPQPKWGPFSRGRLPGFSFEMAESNPRQNQTQKRLRIPAVPEPPHPSGQVWQRRVRSQVVPKWNSKVPEEADTPISTYKSMGCEKIEHGINLEQCKEGMDNLPETQEMVKQRTSCPFFGWVQHVSKKRIICGIPTHCFITLPRSLLLSKKVAL